MKRFMEIVTFPFYLLYQLISFPFSIAKIVWEDQRQKKRGKADRALKTGKSENLSEVGPFLFPNCSNDFKAFFNLFLNDKKAFLTKYRAIFDDYDRLDLEQLKPIETAYLFGASKQELHFTDWRGEEDEKEIEGFIEDKLKIEIQWKYVGALRMRIGLEKQRDGKFILDLFAAIDKDLKPLGKKLVFLDLNWDAFVYALVDQSSYQTIVGRFGSHFHGSEELRKSK